MDDFLAEYRVSVAANGRIVLPKAVRDQLGATDGTEVVIEQFADGVILSTKRQRARRAQKLARELLGHYEGSLVDELIADRRAEAQRESDEFEASSPPARRKAA